MQDAASAFFLRNAAFVSASANQRADIRNIRTNVLSLGVPMRTLDARPGFFPSVGDAIPAVVHLFSWFRTLRSADVSREWIVPVLDRLLALWRFDRFCSRNVPFEQLKLATVFYDSEPLHHLLVRKCQQRKVATATLQHGVILAPREGARDNIDFAGGVFTPGYNYCSYPAPVTFMLGVNLSF